MELGNISVAFNTGLTIGAFTWGLLVDILGVCASGFLEALMWMGMQRRWCFNVTCLFAAVFGFLFAGKRFPGVSSAGVEARV